MEARRSVRPAARAEPPPREPFIDRWIRGQGWMEPVADALQSAVGAVYGALGAPGRALKDVAHGTAVLRHPLHPAVTDVPIGAWITGVILDIVALRTHLVPTQAGDIALAFGLIAGAGAALTGLTDFHETYGQERRVALTHGLTMSFVLVVEAVGLGFRWWGGPALHGPAVILAVIGAVSVTAGAYLGGHLTFGFGTMVNRDAFLEGPADEYVGVGASEDFPEGAMKRVDAGGMPALVVRLDGRLKAISAVCSHAGGPLDEGTLEGGCVTCPWHGSQFRLRDGGVVHGPATFSQPAFRVREEEGKVLLKLAYPLH